jgi:hypothetical protein
MLADPGIINLDDFAERCGIILTHGGLYPWLNGLSANGHLTISRPPPQNVRKILYVIIRYLSGWVGAYSYFRSNV